MTDIHDCEGGHQQDPVRLISTPGQRRMVVLILRGAMDGLDAVQPYGDPALRTLRSTLSVGPEGGAHDLDGFYALHPKLGALLPLWQAGELAFAHAVSTPIGTSAATSTGRTSSRPGPPAATGPT